MRYCWRLAGGDRAPLLLRGLGLHANRQPLGSGKPLRAEGLVQAIRGALDEAGIALKDCDHRIADINGEQYRFKEAALAITRLLRDRKVLFSLGIRRTALARSGRRRSGDAGDAVHRGAQGYLPGPVFLGHLGNDDDKRAAFIAQARRSRPWRWKKSRRPLHPPASESSLMGTEVYANGREIACKASTGKTIADFPDTCLSPPTPPAGPVPIPYPNTAAASDTTNGSTTVMISGQEVMLKDQSTFKTSTGNEAATKSLGMGVITHTI